MFDDVLALVAAAQVTRAATASALAHLQVQRQGVLGSSGAAKTLAECTSSAYHLTTLSTIRLAHLQRSRTLATSCSTPLARRPKQASSPVLYSTKMSARQSCSKTHQQKAQIQAKYQKWQNRPVSLALLNVQTAGRRREHESHVASSLHAVVAATHLAISTGRSSASRDSVGFARQYLRICLVSPPPPSPSSCAQHRLS